MSYNYWHCYSFDLRVQRQQWFQLFTPLITYLGSSDLFALRNIVDTPITGQLEHQMKYGDAYIQVGIIAIIIYFNVLRLYMSI